MKIRSKIEIPFEKEIKCDCRWGEFL